MAVELNRVKSGAPVVLPTVAAPASPVATASPSAANPVDTFAGAPVQFLTSGNSNLMASGSVDSPLKKLWRNLLVWLGVAANKTSNPVAEMDLVISENKARYQQVQGRIANVMVQERAARRSLDDATTELANITQKLDFVVDKGNNEDALRLLQQKTNQENVIATKRATWESLSKAVDGFKGELTEIEGGLRSMLQQKQEGLSMQAQAEAQELINQVKQANSTLTSNVPNMNTQLEQIRARLDKANATKELIDGTLENKDKNIEKEMAKEKLEAQLEAYKAARKAAASTATA